MIDSTPSSRCAPIWAAHLDSSRDETLEGEASKDFWTERDLGKITGVFKCPCHGSKYYGIADGEVGRAGVNFFGPTPRPDGPGPNFTHS